MRELTYFGRRLFYVATDASDKLGHMIRLPSSKRFMKMKKPDNSTENTLLHNAGMILCMLEQDVLLL